jgi:hypothetical protein
MFSPIERNSTSIGGRLLARQLARELTNDELPLIAGGVKGGSPAPSKGWEPHTSSSLTSTQSPCPSQGDEDGGADD